MSPFGPITGSKQNSSAPSSRRIGCSPAAGSRATSQISASSTAVTRNRPVDETAGAVHALANVVSCRGAPTNGWIQSSPSAATYTTPLPSASQSKHPPPNPRPARGSGEVVSIRSGPPSTATNVIAERSPHRWTNATDDPSGDSRGSVNSRPAVTSSIGIGWRPITSCSDTARTVGPVGRETRLIDGRRRTAPHCPPTQRKEAHDEDHTADRHAHRRGAPRRLFAGACDRRLTPPRPARRTRRSVPSVSVAPLTPSRRGTGSPIHRSHPDTTNQQKGNTHVPHPEFRVPTGRGPRAAQPPATRRRACSSASRVESAASIPLATTKAVGARTGYVGES